MRPHVIWLLEFAVEMATKEGILTDRIIVDPQIMAGKPVVKGTRIPVELVLKRLAANLDFRELQADYPRLTLEDIQACLIYAQTVIEGEDFYPASQPQ